MANDFLEVDFHAGRMGGEREELGEFMEESSGKVILYLRDQVGWFTLNIMESSKLVSTKKRVSHQ